MTRARLPGQRWPGGALTAAMALAGAIALATPTAAAGPRPPVAWSAGFERPLSGWSNDGAPRARRVPGADGRRLQLSGRGRGWLSHPLPTGRWALSLDVRPARGSVLNLRLGDARHSLSVRRLASGAARVRIGGRSRQLGAQPNPPRGGWLHLAAAVVDGRLLVAVNGQLADLGRSPGRRLGLAVPAGVALIDNVLATAARDPRGLLLHRLLDLQARVPARAFFLGAEPSGRLHFGPGLWWRGFFAGALWHASDLVGGDSPFQRFALARTLANLGAERRDTHDLGFMYEPSSVAAYTRLCGLARDRSSRRRQCARLRASGLAAAEGLLTLAASNPGGRTIPTRRASPSSTEADTIIDSLMNLPILYWASRATGERRYREVAAEHARRVAELLVRPDGSTSQSAHGLRESGRVLFRHTHQGISADSTWARGQGWALYGLTTSAQALGDRRLLALAERTAAYVESHLPSSGVPPYDYAAPPGAASDLSAGVITAAGLLRLAHLCEQLPGGCGAGPRWRSLGEKMLAAALRRATQRPPLGYMGGQAYTYGGEVRWDDDAELSWGLYYALEAIGLARRESPGR